MVISVHRLVNVPPLCVALPVIAHDLVLEPRQFLGYIEQRSRHDTIDQVRRLMSACKIRINLSNARQNIARTRSNIEAGILQDTSDGRTPDSLSCHDDPSKYRWISNDWFMVVQKSVISSPNLSNSVRMLHDVEIRMVETINNINPTVIIHEAQHVARRRDNSKVISLDGFDLNMPPPTAHEMLDHSITLHDVPCRVKIRMHESLERCPSAEQIAFPHLSLISRLQCSNKVRLEVRLVSVC